MRSLLIGLILLTAVALIGPEQRAYGGLGSLRQANWESCNQTVCYKISIKRGGFSSIIPSLFADDATFKLVSRTDHSILKSFSSSRAIWNQDANRWLFLKPDYSFDATTFTLEEYR